MKFRQSLWRFAAVLFILLGIAAAAYPFLSNFLYDNRIDSDIEVYHRETVSQEAEKQEILDAARSYNAQLETICTVEALFSQKTMQESELHQSYPNLLSITESGMMGFIEIPAIGVYLPIYHGTDEATLQAGVGHLEGSSLPVGGASTHAVLTGHSGLSTMKMFTDIAQLAEGDHFLLHILGDALYYKVDQICVTYPEETQELQIIHGEDHVTLLTCTPYGINSHRLLVRGVRMTEDEVAQLQAEPEYIEEHTEQESVWMAEYKKAVCIGLAVAGTVLVIAIPIIRRSRL